MSPLALTAANTAETIGLEACWSRRAAAELNFEAEAEAEAEAEPGVEAEPEAEPEAEGEGEGEGERASPTLANTRGKSSNR